jgi:signal transduction histidine kinase
LFVLVSITAAEFLRYLTWAIFGILGFWVTAQAIRRPTAINIDIGLLFGGLTLAIATNLLVHVGVLAASRPLESVIATLIVAMPFLLVRLIDDVVGVPRLLLRSAGGLFAVYVAAVWLLTEEQLSRMALLFILGLVVVLGYVVVSGMRAARRAHGVTRRRLNAVTLGSLFLACNFGAGRLPISADDARSLVDIFGLAAGLSYYVGFAPPAWLRRLWQEPELRAYLTQSAGLAQLLDRAAIVQELERGAAAALGAPRASIGLWDESLQALCFSTSGEPLAVSPSADMPAAQAFRTQQAVFSHDTTYTPAVDARYQLHTQARAVLAAPIATPTRRLGVLAVFAPRAPIFAHDDLALVQLLADQAAVVLESRRLNDEAARLRAREEAARLKEDFLSSAAHDLKTPLTTLVMQAQLLERRAARNPGAPAERDGLRRIVRESEHLRTLVLDLLDAAQGKHKPQPERRARFDLATLVRECIAQRATGPHPFALDAPEQLPVHGDPEQLRQLIEELVSNAVLYSPSGETIAISLRQEDAAVRLTVADRGIGIPNDDLPYLFERFHRGSNVDDRRFPGWGLGLSLCRQIVERNGGEVRVSSRLGVGSTFEVTLPMVAIAQEQHVEAHSSDR